MEPIDILKIVAAVVIILILILIAIAIFRRIGGEVRGKRGSRLAVTEYQEVDKSRHLVLVRRDNEEHLLLVGGPQDLVIETNINSYNDGYAEAPPAVSRVPAARQAPETTMPAPAEPKLPPPAPPQYEEYEPEPPPAGPRLRGPGPR